MRNITVRGLELIKQFEGFSSKIYLDSAGLKTIGFGHLILPSETSSFQNGVTEADATTLLKKEIEVAEQAVSRLITSPINQNQFDSLVSFTFNLGSAAFQRSTLRAKINREEHEQVPREFMRWVYAGGIKILGLIRRRRAEAELYGSY